MTEISTMIGLVFPDSLVLQRIQGISEDPLLDQLLQDYGISDLDESLVIKTSLDLRTRKHRFYRRWCWVVDHQNSLPHSGVWHHPDILPDKYTHASNLILRLLSPETFLRGSLYQARSPL